MDVWSEAYLGIKPLHHLIIGLQLSLGIRQALLQVTHGCLPVQRRHARIN